MSDPKVLVFWIESKETSILKKSDTRVVKNRHGEESVRAKWDGKYYDVKIVAENGNKVKLTLKKKRVIQLEFVFLQ